MASFPKRIFCCKAAGPVPVASNIKLHNDPNRELHEAIFRSFLAFALRRQDLAGFVEENAKQRKEESARLLTLVGGITNPDSDVPPPPPPRFLQPASAPIFSSQFRPGILPPLLRLSMGSPTRLGRDVIGSLVCSRGTVQDEG
jgi:hypothetical protein